MSAADGDFQLQQHVLSDLSRSVRHIAQKTLPEYHCNHSQFTIAIDLKVLNNTTFRNKNRREEIVT